MHLAKLLKESGLNYKKKQSDKTGVKTTHWFWGSEAFFPVKAKQAKPELVDKLPEKNSAEEQAQKLLIDNPDMPAATLLNSLKAKGIKLMDEKDTLEADSVTTQAQVARSQESGLEIKSFAKFQEGTIKNAGVGPVRFKVALIEEGLGNLRDGFFYSKQAIESGVQAFEGRKCYADHPSQSEEQDRPERSVRDIIGYFENVKTEEAEDGALKLVGDLVMPPDPPFEWARSLVRNAALYNQKYPDQNLVGLSINASGDAQSLTFDEFLKTYSLPESCKPKLIKAKNQGMDQVKIVTAIKDAISCDLVTEPGAKGKIISVIESETTLEGKDNMKKIKNKAVIESEKKETCESEDEKKMHAAEENEGEKKEASDEDHADEEQDKKLILDMIKKHMGDEEGEMEGEAEAAAMEAYEAYKEMGESEDEAMKCAGKAMKLAKHMAAKRNVEAEDEKKEDEKKESVKKESEVKLEARIAFLERELKKRELVELLDSKLAESGLGRAETDKIRKLIGEPKSEGEIAKTIKIFKEAFSSRGESAKGSGFFLGMEKATVAPAKRSKVSFGDC